MDILTILVVADERYLHMAKSLFNSVVKNVSINYKFHLHTINVSEKYIETITEDTWLKEDITPYELYLKFLYEYFKEENVAKKIVKECSISELLFAVNKTLNKEEENNGDTIKNGNG